MTISDNEIHLWYAFSENINDFCLLTKYYNILNKEERLNLERFKLEKDRHQYLVTRAMVRYVLSHYVKEIAPEHWIFSSNQYGKPYIGNNSLRIPLLFNISHTEKLIVLAVALNYEIGVDVEYLPRMEKSLKIAYSFFSINEKKDLLELPEKKQVNRFSDLWTLKEAYIKACGMGLSIPLDQFSFSFSQQGKICIDFDSKREDHPKYWQFWQIQLSNTHKVSIAVKGDDVDYNYRLLVRRTIPLSEIVDVNYTISHEQVILV